MRYFYRVWFLITFLSILAFLSLWGRELTANCYQSEIKKVQGNSLSGLIESDSEIEILIGFYKCNGIKRGDIVAYRHSGNANPIIKIIKGMPGDRFSVQKLEDGGSRVLINNEILVNHQGQPYLLGEQAYQLLSLYEKDYAGIIPPDAYLIFGNLTGGSLDSSHLGLIHKKDILGKALKTQ